MVSASVPSSHFCGKAANSAAISERAFSRTASSVMLMTVRVMRLWPKGRSSVGS